MAAPFLSAEELDAAPLGSFIPAHGGGRWMRVEGGWRFQWTWIDSKGKQHRIFGKVESTLDAIRSGDVRRDSTVFIQYLPTSSAWHQVPAWIAVCSGCNWHAYLGTLPEIHTRANSHVGAVCRVAA